MFTKQLSLSVFDFPLCCCKTTLRNEFYFLSLSWVSTSSFNVWNKLNNNNKKDNSATMFVYKWLKYISDRKKKCLERIETTFVPPMRFSDRLSWPFFYVSQSKSFYHSLFSFCFRLISNVIIICFISFGSF